MLKALLSLDANLFLLLNGSESTFLDQIMIWFSDKYVWIPFYILLLLLLWIKRKNHFFYLLVGIGLTILLSDQITSGFMKPFFERFRPCHEPGLVGLVKIIDGCGGLYGFASSHAANSFGVAFFYFIVFRHTTWLAILLLLWALLVSYSRVYLGVHYPLDIIVGGAIGCGSAFLSFKILTLINRSLKVLYSAPPKKANIKEY